MDVLRENGGTSSLEYCTVLWMAQEERDMDVLRENCVKSVLLLKFAVVDIIVRMHIESKVLKNGTNVQFGFYKSSTTFIL